MNTNQIDEFASSNRMTKRIYGGCFASDKIVELGKIHWSSLPRVYVVNTCTSNISDARRCHWISIFITRDGVEWFDSGGDLSRRFLNVNEDINRFVQMQAKPITFNRLQLQAFESTHCGLFCLVFVYAKAVGIGLPLLISVFKRSRRGRVHQQPVNLDENDEIVRNMFKCAYVNEKGINCFIINKKKVWIVFSAWIER